MDSVMLESPASAVETCLSPALQSYLRDCVRLRLHSEGLRQPLRLRIQLYLRLGEPASALALERDLRQHDADGDSSVGLIAMFGQLAPGLSHEQAMARQLRPLRGGADAQFADEDTEVSSTLSLQIGMSRYRVLKMHEHASQLHCVMPCPILVFSPVD